MLDIATPEKIEILCEQCGKPFEPRQGSGGKKQRFCCTECRASFHKGQRPQRAPTYSAPETLPAIMQPPKQENAQEAGPGDFDWSNPEKIALQDQPATAIYFNPHGALVIRQQRAWDQHEDTFVYISPENIDDFLEKITDACGVPSFGRD